MKNDQIINARISKIVEAIMKISHPNGRPDFTYWDGRNYDERKEKITEALASLGGEEEVNNDEIVKLDTPFSIKFPKHKDGDLYLLFWLDDVPPDIAYLHKDTGNNGVLMRLKGTDVIVNTDIKIIRRKIEFMAFPAVNWSRVCECDWDSRIGETWCCNHCGLPTSNHSHPSEREVLEFLKKLPLPLPSNHKLVIWANQIRGFYGHPVYLVGSQTTGKENPRDVDVVCGIPDSEFTLRYGDVNEWLEQGATGKWTDVRWNWADDCSKRSIDGMECTGFLIDFKVQPMAQFNGFAHIPKIRLDTKK